MEVAQSSYRTRAILGWLKPTLLLLATGTGPIACAESQHRSGADGEWASYGHDYTEQRFARSTSIDRQTIKRLGLQWSLDLPNETSLVATPLMVGRTIYFTGKFSMVYAVSATSGRIRWVFDPRVASLWSPVAND